MISHSCRGGFALTESRTRPLLDGEVGFDRGPPPQKKTKFLCHWPSWDKKEKKREMPFFCWQIDGMGSQGSTGSPCSLRLGFQSNSLFDATFNQPTGAFFPPSGRDSTRYAIQLALTVFVSFFWAWARIVSCLIWQSTEDAAVVQEECAELPLHSVIHRRIT